MPECRLPLPRLFALSLAASLVVPLALAGSAAATPAFEPAAPTAAATSRADDRPPVSGSDAATLLDSALKPAKKDLPAQNVDPNAAEHAAAEIHSGIESGANLSASERIKLSEQALDAVGLEAMDAQLGQGVQRIEESGDPQAPTLEELDTLATAVRELAVAAPEAPGTDAPKEAPEPDKAEASPSAAAAAAGTLTAAAAVFSGTETTFEGNLASVSAPSSLQDLRTWRPPGVLGIDVSHHQGNVNWSHAWGKGARFAYIKATQSWPTTLFKDPKFSQNYAGSANTGMMRGAYHFAMPAHSSGATQAKQFLANGGGWSADGKTLPPLLDIEWNPYKATQYSAGKGDMCYGLTPSKMVSWIQDFGKTVKATTGRLPMIYTAQSWWDKCTGDSTAFKDWPLHVSIFPTAEGPKNPRELPEGWTTFNIWQYSSNADMIGSSKNVDANVWNGDLTSLRDFARNKRSTPYRLITDYLGNNDVTPTRLAPVRLAGATRYDTSVAISRRTFPSNNSIVVVASGENFPDALSGSPLATLVNAPLLLTQKNVLPVSVAAELKRLKPKRILIIGSSKVISDATAKKIGGYGAVTRISGNTRYDTNVRVLQQWNSAPTVFVATGQRFEDAMSLAAVAAGRKAPLLLTGHSTVPAATLKELKRLRPTKVYLAGSPNAISNSVMQKLQQAVPNATVVRYGGASLYDTNAVIAKAFWPSGSQRQFIATGSNYPDGLTGAVAAGHNGAPLLLGKKACLPHAVSNSLASMKGWTNVLVGSSKVLDETVAYRYDGKPNVC